MMFFWGSPTGSELSGLNFKQRDGILGRRGPPPYGHTAHQSWRERQPWVPRVPGQHLFCAFCLLALFQASCPPPAHPRSLITLGVFGQAADLSSQYVVSQESMEVGVNVCVCGYACTRAGYQTLIKLFYCILSDRSSVYSSALSHLNKTSICNNPINRKPY